MNKENILYAIIGVMLGVILGFVFANSYMRSQLASGQVTTASSGTMQQNSNMPAGHPDVNGQQMPNGQTQPAPVSPDLQPAVDKAKANPTDFEAQVKAAELLSQAEQYQQASEFLKAANKIKPDDYQTIVNLGNVNFDGGNLDEAEKWYSAALQQKKDDNSVRTDLGLTFVFREKPDYDRAVQEFNTVLASDPNHIQALQNSVVAYMKKGDIPKAKENLARLEAADPKNPAIPKLKEQLNKGATK